MSLCSLVIVITKGKQLMTKQKEGLILILKKEFPNQEKGTSLSIHKTLTASILKLFSPKEWPLPKRCSTVGLGLQLLLPLTTQTS